MTHVRRPLTAALALFTIAIGLDRAGNAAGSDVVGTASYAISAVALVAPLVWPALRRRTPWLHITATAGGLVGLSALLGTGFFGHPVAPHIAAIEVAFVLLSALLGHALGAALDAVERLLATSAVGESPAIDLEGPRAANEIHTEIARSRRHDRPLSVTVLEPTPAALESALGQASLELDRRIRARFLFGSLAGSVAAVLRRSDLLFEHRPTGRLIVLSPETDTEGARLLAERVIDAAGRSGIDARAATASFPVDGFGFETLVEKAQQAIAEQEAAPAVPHLWAVEQGGAS